MAYSFEQTKAGYAKLWDQATITHPAQAKAQAERILDPNARAILSQVQAATGVPWFMVGVMLYRESDLSFGTYLGNGQSLRRKTTVVPIGRGPFNTFLDGAVDAISLQGIMVIKEWTIERILYEIERFNGQGYFSHGNSPYVWSWTSLYTAGKFVADHVFSPTFVDPQGGCAAILKAIFEIEPALMPKRIASPATPQEKPPVTTAPTTTPAPSAVNANLVQITHTLETVVNFLPTVAMFFPPLKVAVPFIPLIQGVLKMLEDLENAPHDPQAIADLISSHLQSISQAVQQTKTAAGASVPGGSTTTGG